MVPDQWQRRIRRASGFTLMEVMIAMAILAIGASAVTAAFSSLVGFRHESNDLNTVNSLLAGIDNRIQGTSPEDLLSGFTWLRPRPVLKSGNTITNVDGSNGPLLAADLQALGLLNQTTSLPGLRVYIEYYRGMRTVSDAVSGIETLDANPGNTDPTLRRHLLSDPPLTNWTGCFRDPRKSLMSGTGVAPALADAFLVPRNGGEFPTLASLNRDSDWHLVIRIIVAWRPQGGDMTTASTIPGAPEWYQYREIITGRRIPRVD